LKENVMMCSRGASCRVVIAAVLFMATAFPLRALADDGGRAKETLRLMSTSVKGAAHPSVWNDMTLGVGDSATETDYAGFSATGGFVSGGGGGPLATLLARYAETGRPAPPFQYSWKVTVKLVSVDAGEIKFDADWARSDVLGTAEQPVAGGHRTITLREGERHVLDVINAPSHSVDVVNVVIELTASRVEEPGLENAALDYDLWLVHERENGEKITRRLTVTGRQGENVPFEFAPLDFSLEAGGAVDAANAPLKMSVQGKIRGRARPDGSIEISVQSEQAMQLGGARGAAIGDKNFVVLSGETTAIEFPRQVGYSIVSRIQAPTSPRPGVTVQDGKTRVDGTQFFARQKTSLLVTVHRRQ
jgi:hypothetical protein